MRNNVYIGLILILIIGFLLRLYGITNPLADWHSWRQVDTSAVSRTLVNDGFDILNPKYHDLSNVPSGIDNPEGYRFVEFPLYNALQAGSYMLFPSYTLEMWGRLITIFSSLLSIIFIFLIVRNHATPVAGLLAALFYAVIPFNVYFNRVILPDPNMVMFMLGGIYFFDRWLKEKTIHPEGEYRQWQWYILSLLFTACALLLKPYALFFTLPMIYLAWKHLGFRFITRWELWGFLLLSLIPLIWWRSWITQHPEGIPASDWLLNGGNIRFKGAYFFWIFADRIGRLILGYWGIFFFTIGLLAAFAKQKKDDKKIDGLFFYSFLLSSLLYVVVIARGNVQHDYYQILIIPTLAMFCGLGANFLMTRASQIFQKPAVYGLSALCFIFTVGFGWYFVRDFYNINNPNILVAGKAVDRLTPKDAKVIAPYDGDTTFLYHTNRKGWASFQYGLPEMIQLGASYLVLVNPNDDQRQGFGAQYEIVASEPEYLLIKLR
jgi:hypothetical protein